MTKYHHAEYTETLPKFPWRIKMNLVWAFKIKPGSYNVGESQKIIVTVDAGNLQEANAAALRKVELFVAKEEGKTFQAFVVESEILP